MKSPLALIVEDDPNLAAVFCAAVRDAGFATEAILDGSLALDRIKSVLPRVVILNINSLEDTGFTLLKRIRADQRLLFTSVVVTTCETSIQEQVCEIADLVLLQPISFWQLRDVAAALFSIN